MKKVTKQNWKAVVKDLKAKNVWVYTARGKRKRASEVDFKLFWNVKGSWELVAYVK